MVNTTSISKPLLGIIIVVGYMPSKDLAKKYQQKMEDSAYHCEIFNNINDARAWIDPSL